MDSREATDTHTHVHLEEGAVSCRSSGTGNPGSSFRDARGEPRSEPGVGCEKGFNVSLDDARNRRETVEVSFEEKIPRYLLPIFKIACQDRGFK